MKVKRTVSMKRSLLESFVLLVLILSVMLLVSTLVVGYGAANRSCEAHFRQAAGGAGEAVSRLTSPVAAVLQASRDTFENGVLHAADPAAMNAYFTAFMTRIPHLTSINTGDAEGNGYLILADGNGWRNRLVDPALISRGCVRLASLSKDLRVTSSEVVESDYDPRPRPWYVGALGAPEEPYVWTEPYTFRTTGDVGITVSGIVRPPTGNSFVLAFDIMLKDISRFTRGFRPTPRGETFVMLGSGKLVGLPAGDAEMPAADDAMLLRDCSALGRPEITDAVETWGKAGRPYAETLRFKTESGAWRCRFSPLDLGTVDPFVVATVIPEADLLGDVKMQALVIGVSTALALLAALVLAMLLSRKYVRPMRGLADIGDALRQLDTTERDPPVSDIEEIVRLCDTTSRMRVALDAFARYIPSELVRDLLELGEAAELGGRFADLTILFTDIRDFTAIAERMQPRDLILHMEEYFDVVLRELRREQATVDKFVGDAVIAFWGAPKPLPDHVPRALRAVWSCARALDACNQAWQRAGKPVLYTRFGVTTGEVVVGNVGSHSRMNYTVLGDNVNLASRLEGLNKTYGTQILAADPIPAIAGDTFQFRRVGTVAVKGREQPTGVFEVLGPAGSVPEATLAARDRYEEAWRLFAAGRFREADPILADLLGRNPEDGVVRYLAGRCAECAAGPLPDGWDGVHRFGEK